MAANGDSLRFAGEKIENNRTHASVARGACRKKCW